MSNQIKDKPYVRKKKYGQGHCKWQGPTGEECTMGLIGGRAKALPTDELCLYHWAIQNKIEDERVLLSLAAHIARRCGELSMGPEVKYHYGKNEPGKFRNELIRLSARWAEIYMHMKDTIHQYEYANKKFQCPWCGMWSNLTQDSWDAIFAEYGKNMGTKIAILEHAPYKIEELQIIWLCTEDIYNRGMNSAREFCGEFFFWIHYLIHEYVSPRTYGCLYCNTNHGHHFAHKRYKKPRYPISKNIESQRLGQRKFFLWREAWEEYQRKVPQKSVAEIWKEKQKNLSNSQE